MLMLTAGHPSNDLGTTLLVLARLRQSSISDIISPTLYDDLDAVLAEYPESTADEVPGLTHRLDAALAQLLEVVPYRANPRPDALLHRATLLLAEPVPKNPSAALGLLRRIAVATLALADLLGEDPSGPEDEE